MKQLVSLFLFSTIFSLHLFASPGGGYRIEVEIQNFEGDTLELGYYFGKSQYLKDTTLINNG